MTVKPMFRSILGKRLRPPLTRLSFLTLDCIDALSASLEATWSDLEGKRLHVLVEQIDAEPLVSFAMSVSPWSLFARAHVSR